MWHHWITGQVTTKGARGENRVSSSLILLLNQCTFKSKSIPRFSQNENRGRRRWIEKRDESAVKKLRIMRTILRPTNKLVVNKKTYNDRRTRTNTFWGFYCATFFVYIVFCSVVPFFRFLLPFSQAAPAKTLCIR